MKDWTVSLKRSVARGAPPVSPERLPLSQVRELKTPARNPQSVPRCLPSVSRASPAVWSANSSRRLGNRASPNVSQTSPATPSLFLITVLSRRCDRSCGRSCALKAARGRGKDRRCDRSCGRKTDPLQSAHVHEQEHASMNILLILSNTYACRLKAKAKHVFMHKGYRPNLQNKCDIAEGALPLVTRIFK